jgi:hypothetical protein
MSLSLDYSERISYRLKALMRLYESGEYLELIQEGEALESSLPTEDWNDIHFIYLKLILYCSYKSVAEVNPAASDRAALRKQEMLDHNADPECNPLSFMRRPE